MNARYNDGYDSYNRYHRGNEYEARDGIFSKILLVILAVIFPPLAVFLIQGFRGHFWLNLLLLILFYVPALVHAIWLIARR
jgi:uncharacterized membrane protein YqaE (UPF0057 family)